MRALHGRGRSLLATTLLVSMWPILATADILEAKLMSVKDRPRPEYEPLGLLVGSITVRPAVSVEEVHDDNVFAQDEDATSDWITSIASSLSVHSDARVPWSVYGTVTTQKYAEQSSEDRSDWNTGGSLTQRIGSNSRATLVGEYSRNHVPRDDPSITETVAEPPRFDSRTIGLNLLHTFSHGAIALKAQQDQEDYADVALSSGGILDQDFRDRSRRNVDLRTDFAVGANTSIFLRATHAEYRYDDADATQLERDSNTDALYAGTSFEISNLIRGDLGVGTLRLNNEDANQQDRRSLAISGELTYFVTPIISATVELRRNSGASDLAGSSSYIATSGAATVDYEVLRNLLLELRFARTERDYSGLEGRDLITSHTLELQWLANRALKMGIGFSREEQDWQASNPGRRFEQNTISVTVGLAL